MRLMLAGLSALAVAITFVVALDEFGFGGRPWFGWWDSNIAIAGPYTVAIRPRRDGAAERGGLRDGDRIDLREQSLETRVATVYQLMATQPTVVRIRRGNSTLTVSVLGSTAWENATFWKLQPGVSRAIYGAWLAFCIFLLALLRWPDSDTRRISLVLFCLVGEMLDPSYLAVPTPTIALLQLLASRACATVASVTLVRLSSEYGARSLWRKALEYVAYAAAFLAFFADSVVAVGLMTLWIDPLPWILSLSQRRSYLDVAVSLLVLLATSAAVMTTIRAKRLQALWLLLPLPIALLGSSVSFAIPAFVHSWFTNVAVIAIANGSMLLGSFVVTCALLKQRGSLVPTYAG